MQYFRLSRIARIATIAVAVPAMIAVCFSLAAEELTQDGLKISVKRAAEKAGVPGYTLFQVVAENPTKEDRTLHGLIRLTWKDASKPGSPAIAESDCVAFLEIPAGHRLSEAVPCKGEKFSNFVFSVRSVLPFVLDRSPLKWQKAEALK